MLPPVREYETFLYTLSDTYSSIRFSTLPHHKHIPPDIKHRVPAPNLSFTEPNPPALIKEIEATLTGSIQEGG